MSNHNWFKTGLGGAVVDTVILTPIASTQAEPFQTSFLLLTVLHISEPIEATGVFAFSATAREGGCLKLKSLGI